MSNQNPNPNQNVNNGGWTTEVFDKIAEHSKTVAKVVAKAHKDGEIVDTDSLVQMFEKQKQFQKQLTGQDLPCINYQQFVYSTVAMMAELGEVMQADKNWKNWISKERPVDREALLDEIVDVYHFLINMTLYLGFDSHDVIDQFFKKNKVNFERQSGGY